MRGQRAAGFAARVRAACCCAASSLACGDAVHADPGLDAAFRVEGGRFFRDGLPTPSGGPQVLGAFLAQATFRVGEQDKSFGGVTEAGATGVAIALDAEPGYWVVPTGMPLAETPDLPSFDAPLSLSAAVAAGPHTLLVWASNLEGAFGEAALVELSLVPPASPQGRLVVSLRWDSPSDLDLHVVTPDGTEIFNGNVNSWQTPLGAAPDPEAWRRGGILDFDSNAGCRIDGRQNENVVWSQTPPSGVFTVRVDTPSLCGQPGARWHVDALLDDQVIGAATGSSFQTATRFPPGRHAGVLALEFVVP